MTEDYDEWGVKMQGRDRIRTTGKGNYGETRAKQEVARITRNARRPVDGKGITVSVVKRHVRTTQETTDWTDGE